MLNLDTHILLFALAGNIKPREEALLSINRWSISAIVLWEITKLAQLKRIDISLSDRQLSHILKKITVHEISTEICLNIPKLDFTSDPADEIIAATSLTLNIPLLTRDNKIRKSKIVPLA